MKTLDDLEKIKQLDHQDMRSSIEKLGDQVINAWEGTSSLDLSGFHGIQNVVFAAMGGSGLGADFVQYVFPIKVPFQIVHTYKLPEFVNENTLVIAASYSGTTEETISCFEDAVAKKAKVVCLATGEKLANMAEEKGIPFYLFDEEYNPSRQPRMGSCFSIGSLLAILSKLDLVAINEDTIKLASKVMKDSSQKFSIDIPFDQNEAKKVAEQLVGKITIVLSAEFLSGVAHIFTNQINENAKNFAAYFLLSEMNHHLLEGAKFPENLGGQVKFIFLESENMTQRMKQRLDITKEVLNKANIDFVEKKFAGDTSLVDAFSALVFSSWTNFYMAMEEQIDPSPIPTVDFFKEKLGQ